MSTFLNKKPIKGKSQEKVRTPIPPDPYCHDMIGPFRLLGTVKWRNQGLYWQLWRRTASTLSGMFLLAFTQLTTMLVNLSNKKNPALVRI
jgi:hypothetical protein